MKTRVLGIDLGLTGAICLLRSDGLVESLEPIPTTEWRKGRRKVSIPTLHEHLRSLRFAFGPMIAVYEDVYGRPPQGVSQAGSLMHGKGVVESLLYVLAIGSEAIQPAIWKRDLGLWGRPKDASREKAAQLFPSEAWRFEKKGSDGPAEALLLAEWEHRRRRVQPCESSPDDARESSGSSRPSPSEKT